MIKKFNIKEWQDKYLKEGVKEDDVYGFVEMVGDAITRGRSSLLAQYGTEDLEYIKTNVSSDGKAVGKAITLAMLGIQKYEDPDDYEDGEVWPSEYLNVANKLIKKVFGTSNAIDIRKIKKG